MSDEDPIVNGVPLSSLRVVDLKAELDKHGLSKLGNKVVLAERLKEFLLSSGDGESAGNADESPQKEKSASPTKSPVAENAIVAAYRAKQRAALEQAKKDAMIARRESESETDVKSPSKTEDTPTKQVTEEEKEVKEKSTEPKTVEVVAEKEKQVEAASPAKETTPPPPPPAKQTSPEAPKPKKAKESSPDSDPEASSDSSSSVDAGKDESVSPPAKDAVIADEDSMEAVEAKDAAAEDSPRNAAGADKAASVSKGDVDEKEKEKETLSAKEEKSAQSKKVSPPPSSPPAPVSATASASFNNGASVEDEEQELDYGDEEKEPEAAEEEKEVDETDHHVGKEEHGDETMDVDDAHAAPARHVAKTSAAAAASEAAARETTRKRRESNTEGERKSSTGAREISPSRHPESDVVHIRGLVRPFTLPNLRAHICSQGGRIEEFWIDQIRSHCFAQMRSVDEAKAVRLALHNTHWPDSNPKTLSVQFDTVDNLNRNRDGKVSVAPSTGSSAAVPSTPSVASRLSVTTAVASAAKSLEKERERPTLGSMPGRNGSLRVTVEAALRDNKKRDEVTRDRKVRESRDGERPVVTITGKDENRENGEGARKRHRSETPPFSRSVTEKKRERVDTRDAGGDRQRRESTRQTREEVEVKTADALFQKTKAQPAIFYMPLGEEEALSRASKREAEKKREEERLKERSKH